MTSVLRLRSARVALATSTLAGLSLCSSPLLGVHGVESAIVLGVLLPPFVAAVGARVAIAARREGLPVASRATLERAWAAAAIVLAAPVLLLALNGFRVRQCAPLEGLAFMALGPLIGCLLASTVGVLVGAWVRGPRLATTAAVLVPVVAAALGVVRFWESPAVFVYGHFAGWFPGTIYDEGVEIPGALLSFRATSILLGLGLSLIFVAASERVSGRFAARRALGAWPRAALGAAALAGVVTAELFADELGHESSSAHIAQELGKTAWGQRCVLHVPREMRPREVRELVRDCDFRVEQSERLLGVTQRRRVAAFFFRSAEEKQRYMGAARTFVAKPWRDEVYLQLRGWPHPILFHEIVHVVAGNAARGPFRVGGSLSGWLPDPALIEGVAVAVAWNERDGLTPHQWAKAMVELEMMPPLDDVVGLSFLGQPARNAYTISGSFIRWLLDTRGAGVVREAYRTGDLAVAAGEPLVDLERQWRAFLDEQPLPDEALELARARFSQRSIFSAICPHEVAKLRARLGEDLSAGDDRRAVDTCAELLDIDRTDSASRAHYVGALARLGDDALAAQQLSILTAEPAPEPIVVMARQSLADAAWRAGDEDAALAIYFELLSRPQTEDAARALEVRVEGLRRGGTQARLIFDLLVGRDGVTASAALATHLARELGDARDDGLGPYLEARQMMFAQEWERALPLAREARGRALPTARLSSEARRMEGTIHFALGRLDDAEAVWRSALSDPRAGEGDRVTAGDWIERIAWTRERRISARAQRSAR